MREAALERHERRHDSRKIVKSKWRVAWCCKIYGQEIEFYNCPVFDAGKGSSEARSILFGL